MFFNYRSAKSSTEIFALTRGAEALSCGCVRLPRCRVITGRETSPEEDWAGLCGERVRERTTADPDLEVTGRLG